MIFFYTDNPKKSILEDCAKNNYYVIDCNLNNFFYLKNKFHLISYKKLNENLNFISYKKPYKDFKANTLFSVSKYLENNSSDDYINFIFDISHKNNTFFLDCINSLVNRKKIFHTITKKSTERFCLKVIQIKEILSLINFLLKTNIISDCEDFFDFIYNYYFYLSEDYKKVKSIS